MGRKVGIIDRSLREWYVPDIDENRTDPEPFRVQISPMTGKDVRELRASISLNALSLERDDVVQAAERREYELQQRVVSEYVHDVEHYSALDIRTNEVIVPKTGAELVEVILTSAPSEIDVIMDIYSAIEKASSLSVDTKKKQNSQLSSLCLETSAGKPGVAQNVEDQSLPAKTGYGNNVIATEPPRSAPSVVTGHQS